MSTNKAKIIREYGLPATPKSISFELTGEWQVLRVADRYGKPCLYVLEDQNGPRTKTDFFIQPTETALNPDEVTLRNVYLGSYAAPGFMLHVFGPYSACSDYGTRTAK